MKKSFEPDFHALRKPLLCSAVLLMTAVALIFGSLHFRNTMFSDKRQQEDRVQELANNYRELVESEHIIETLYGEYQTLEKLGFIGSEPRLRWLETLRRIGDKNGIMAMQYRLHEQGVYSRPLPLDGGDYQLYASAMDLQVDVLHEGNLLVFFDRLYSSGAGMLDIQGCTIRRLGSDAAQPGVPNIRADCKLSWYTIRQETSALPDEAFM